MKSSIFIIVSLFLIISSILLAVAVLIKFRLEEKGNIQKQRKFPAAISLSQEQNNIFIKENWNFVSGDWRKKNGTLEQTNFTEEQALAFLKDISFLDVSMEVVFKIKNIGTIEGVNLVCGAQDNSNFYSVQLAHLSNQVIISLVTSHGIGELGRKKGVKIPANQWQKVKVECREAEITAYLNDEQILTVTDNTFLSGGIGIGTTFGRVLFKDIKLYGEEGIISSGHDSLISDYKAITSQGWQGFPDIERLSTGEIMVVYYEGYAHTSLPAIGWPRGGKIMYMISNDQGNHWSGHQILVDTEYDDRDPSLVQLKDGTLLVTFFLYSGAEWKERAQVFITKSKNNGKSWEPPLKVTTPFDAFSATSSKILELSDGTLLMPIYGGFKDKRGISFAGILRSSDKGISWNNFSLIPSGSDTFSIEEPTLIQLEDSKIIAVVRRTYQEEDLSMAQSFSSDGGKSWTELKDIYIKGASPALLLTSKGVLLLAHRWPGTSVSYSFNKGGFWHRPKRINVVTGAYPSMVELGDGAIVIVYFDEAKNSQVLLSKFQILPEGIKIISD